MHISFDKAHLFDQCVCFFFFFRSVLIYLSIFRVSRSNTFHSGGSLKRPEIIKRERKSSDLSTNNPPFPDTRPTVYRSKSDHLQRKSSVGGIKYPVTPPNTSKRKRSTSVIFPNSTRFSQGGEGTITFRNFRLFI